MSKAAFTIVLNGLHHLKHDDYAEYLASILDQWVIVEGLALPGGSTSWCRNIPDNYHKNGHSIDGTIEYLKDLKGKHANITVISNEGPWSSKDDMVNAAMGALSKLPPVTHLFEIDADEVWTETNLNAAISDLDNSHASCGQFLSDYYVGPGLLARGEWGESRIFPYRRLWRYKSGMIFRMHEPPEMDGGNGVTVLLPQRFKHYAYYYEQDVKFKNDYYTGHDDIYAKWLDLQKETTWPQPLSRLISGFWGKTNTRIEKE